MRDILCKIGSEEVKQELHGHDVTICQPNGKSRKVAIPIYRPENMGEVMAIDEKDVGGECYTILTNSATGQIVLMAQCHNAASLIDIIGKFDESLRSSVKVLTRDMSTTYEETGETVFPDAKHVIDKFHVLRLLFGLLQELRISLKNREENRQAEEKKQYNQKYKENMALPADRRKAMSKVFHPKRMSNGETLPELPCHSQYWLYKNVSDWSPSQHDRGLIAVTKFPELLDAYTLTADFRRWYKPDENTPIEEKTAQLKSWLKQLSVENNLIPFAATVKKNWSGILNYFTHHYTNANAESTNAKIQLAVIKNRGCRDLDFFCYRIAHFL